MRVFVDTNILIDIMVPSRPAYGYSKQILGAASVRDLELVLTGLTLVNALYAIRKAGIGKAKVVAIVRELLHICKVASTDMPQLQAALASEWNDFEDAVQYHAALSVGGIEVLVTSDRKGYRDARLPVLDPKEFVTRYLANT